MSRPQYVQTVEQWEEQMFREELEARRIEDANEILAEMTAERDAERIEEKLIEQMEG